MINNKNNDKKKSSVLAEEAKYELVSWVMSMIMYSVHWDDLFLSVFHMHVSFSW